jgi:hypothetical protein
LCADSEGEDVDSEWEEGGGGGSDAESASSGDSGVADDATAFLQQALFLHQQQQPQGPTGGVL